MSLASRMAWQHPGGYGGEVIKLERVVKTLAKVAVFLLEEYLRYARMKQQSYLATGKEFQQDSYIAAAMREGADELRQRIRRAEALLAELEA